MKRIALVLLAALLALAGCAPRGGVEVVQETPEAPTPPATVSVSAAAAVTSGTVTPTATPVPTATPQPEPVTYAIEGQTIVREQGGGRTVIYDATEQFPSDWDCWLGNLTVQPEALYFTEGGIPKASDGNDEDTEHALIRIGFDGSGRTVLHSKGVIGYLQLVPYGERIFFIADGSDSTEVGWAWRDGSGSDMLDTTDYAAQYDMPPWYSCSALYVKDGMLYADITLFGDYDQTGQEHTVRIGEDLSLTRVGG